MDKQENVVYAYNGILFRLYKEGNSETYYLMDDPRSIMLTEMSK